MREIKTVCCCYGVGTDMIIFANVSAVTGVRGSHVLGRGGVKR
jgi:hypothetical protein